MGTRLTILLLLPDRVVRADFTGRASPTLVGLWRGTLVDADSDMVSAVEAALGLGPRRLGRVCVLSTDVWTQCVGLPVRAVAGLDREPVTQALAYEAEAASGISGADSSLGFCDLGVVQGERRYWLCQMSAQDLAQLEAAVARHGGKLAGVAHPAGCVAPRDRDAAEHPRVELWPAHIVSFGAGEVEVVAADPRLVPWRTVLQPLLREHDASLIEHLACSADLLSPDDRAPAWRTLDDEPALRAWLASSAAAVAPPAPGVPVIRPAARSMSARQRDLLTLALMLAVLLACAGHYAWLGQRRQRDQHAVDQAKARSTSYTRLTKQAAVMQAQAKTLQAQVAWLEQQETARESAYTAQRRRWAALLTLLSQYCGRDTVVQQITAKGYDVTIAGFCLHPSAASDLASRLQGELARLNWRVQPPVKRASLALPDGGPWSFQITAVNDPMSGQPDAVPPVAGSLAGAAEVKP